MVTGSAALLVAEMESFCLLDTLDTGLGAEMVYPAKEVAAETAAAALFLSPEEMAEAAAAAALPAAAAAAARYKNTQE